MMRSLYSGVAGLKTHQTKMDVIGNNIANTNTVGFKSSSVNFSDTYYQTISSATGPNTEMATAGTNGKQIGLGSMVAAIQTNITEQGGPSTTNRALDIAINGEAFMVVRSGTDTCFTKSGALNIDPSGNLYCTTNGATVQGWLTDDDGNILKDTVKDLKVMSADNMYYPPEATSCATISGNIDPNDPDLDINTGEGEIVTYSFYDNLGEAYTVKLRIKQAAGTTTTPGTASAAAPGQYTVDVIDVLNSSSESIFVTKTTTGTGSAATTTYAASGAAFTWGGTAGTVAVDPNDGTVTITGATATLAFTTQGGTFAAVGPGTTAPTAGESINFCITNINGLQGPATPFPQSGVEVYFNSLTQYSQGGTSKISSVKGREVENGYVDTGHTAGKMKGVSVDEDGKVWGSYDNGAKKCLGQIAFATFPNPSGLESLGGSLFGATQNSGEFDGIGEEIDDYNTAWFPGKFKNHYDF